MGQDLKVGRRKEGAESLVIAPWVRQRGGAPLNREGVEFLLAAEWGRGKVHVPEAGNQCLTCQAEAPVPRQEVLPGRRAAMASHLLAAVGTHSRVHEAPRLVNSTEKLHNTCCYPLCLTTLVCSTRFPDDGSSCFLTLNGVLHETNEEWNGPKILHHHMKTKPSPLSSHVWMPSEHTEN